MKPTRGRRKTELRLPPQSPDALRRLVRGRVRLAGSLLGLALTVSALRGVQLILFPEPVIVARQSRRWAVKTVEGRRGRIMDRQGNALVRSLPRLTVAIDPQAVREAQTRNYNRLDVDRFVSDVARVLEVKESLVRSKVEKDAGRYHIVAKNVTSRTQFSLEELPYGRSEGLIKETQYRRFYSHNGQASQVLGYVGHDGSGVTGLELTFDEDLKGQSSSISYLRTRRGEATQIEAHEERHRDGLDLHTTLDSRMMKVVHEALLDVGERSEPMFATAVVLDVATGDVLAMDTLPGFNANLVDERRSEFGMNRAVTDAIEPGSVLKPFTFAAALEEGTVRPMDYFATGSSYRINGKERAIHDDHPHEGVTAMEMVKFSSNIASAMMAEKLGPERLLGYFRDFGFGERTGVGLPREARGIVHDPAKVRIRALASMSFGQSMTATALQLAVAVATIGNDGVRVKPRLVTRAERSDGQIIPYPVMTEGRVVSSETAQTVRRAMEMVTEEGGTGQFLGIDGYRLGGKTGTAWDVENGRYSATERIASFIGLVPIDDPQIAVAVMVRRPSKGSRYGGPVAGPVFTAVAKAFFEMEEIKPTVSTPELPPNLSPEPLSEVETPPIALRWDGEGWVMPALVGRSMREVLTGLQGAQVQLAVVGHGQLVEQQPKAGQRVLPGERVSLQFE